MIGGETETSNINRATASIKSSKSGSPENSQDVVSKKAVCEFPELTSNLLQEIEIVENGKIAAKGKFDRRMSMHSSEHSDESCKEPLSDVWIFDTFMRTWQ